MMKMLANLSSKKSKKNFEEVAKKYSNDSNAESGGNIGWRKEGELPQLFNDQIKKIDVGDVTTPFKSANGFHILKINENNTKR